MPTRKKTHKVKTHRVKTPWLLRQRQRQRRHTRRQQRGGRYIGAGTYGCGFRPALRCDGEATRRQGKFAKLLPTRYAEEEMMYRALLQPRDPHRQYFLYPEAMCTPAPYAESDEMDRCRHRAEFADRSQSRVVIMGKGGQNLDTLSLRPHEYLPFFRSLTNLFRGLAAIHADGIAHMDIKPPNIVTRRHADGTFHTRLIDFGLMVDPRRLDALAAMPRGTFREYDVFKSNYMYWPFEVRLAVPGFIDAASDGTPGIMAHRNAFYREITTARQSVPYESFTVNQLTAADMADIAGTLLGMDNVAKYRRLFPPADVHGLGMTLAQIFYRFIGHRDGGTDAPSVCMRPAPGSVPMPIADIAENDNIPFPTLLWHQTMMAGVSIRLYTLIRRMTHKRPASRPTIEEALAEYEAILDAMADGLTPEFVTAHVKPWMLTAGVLKEGASPAREASSSSPAAAAAEVPPSPGPAAVPLPESPAAAGGAGHSPRRAAAMPPGVRVLPNLAEGRENMASVSSNSSRRPELIPPGFGVSSSTRGSAKTNTTNSYNSSEERRLYDEYLEEQYRRYEGW